MRFYEKITLVLPLTGKNQGSYSLIEKGGFFHDIFRYFSPIYLQ